MEPGVSSDTGAFQELEKTIKEKKLAENFGKKRNVAESGRGSVSKYFISRQR